MKPKTDRRVQVFAGVSMAIGVLLAGLSELVATPRVQHYSFGHGPSVVIVHGLGGSVEDWLPAARYLARTHRVTLAELPGHGSSPMAQPFTLARATRAIHQVIEAQSGPVVLVGHSLGGLVAAAEALEAPERLRAVVLVETALRPQFDGEDRRAMLAAMNDDFDGLLRGAYLSFGRDSVQGVTMYARAAANEPAMLKRWIRLALEADLSERVGELGVPVLAVLSDRSWPHDEPWPMTAAALGYTGIRDLQPMRMDGCGHFVMLDRPRAMAAAIARFTALPDGEPVARR